VRTIIFLDYDSVLNDLGLAWLRWLNPKFGVNITQSDILHFNWLEENFPGANEFWATPGIYHNHVKPLPGSHDFVARCIHLVGRENVFVLTSSLSNMEHEKDEHIMYHYGLDLSQIIHAHDKAIYTKEGILVDDHPKNCINHINTHCTHAILFDKDSEYGWSKPERYDFYEPSYHDRFIHRCTDYTQVLRCIRRHLC